MISCSRKRKQIEKRIAARLITAMKQAEWQTALSEDRLAESLNTETLLRRQSLFALLSAATETNTMERMSSISHSSTVTN